VGCWDGETWQPIESLGSAVPTRKEYGALEVFPNPFTFDATISMRGPSGMPHSVQILDLQGRLVRALDHHPGPSGTGWVRWDGRGVAGMPLPSGTYLCRIRSAGGTTSIALIKRR
ncbi:MAG: T9SS type A sorting domain-containing protein, partial [Candidatus Eisenbacteria bacterium]|nr:T9SS type A sorting domain-containing protein [Candidatus Eisenbacteria bacterium]